MAYIIQSNILPNPFSYECIMVRRTNHSYKVIQICRDNNLSHFCQITFFNFLQAPKKEQALFQALKEQTPRVSTIATFAFLLIIPQIIEQKKDTSTQPFIYSWWTIQFIYKRYIPGPHIPFSVHFSRWQINTCIIMDLSSMIPLISASSRTKRAWTLEIVETKSMKGAIFHVSTCHHGLLVQCIRCGLSERYRPYHGFYRHFDGLAKRKEFLMFVWGYDVK